MKVVFDKIDKKIKRHKQKIKQHRKVLKSLELEFNNTTDKSDKKKVEKQILSTIKSIEYHKGSAQAYHKAINIVKMYKKE